MDQTKRPLQIPPEFGYYSEKHGIFDMYKRLLEQLIITKPEEPIQFLIDVLKRDKDIVPNVIVLGPPASGKRTIASMICAKTRSALLTTENMIAETDLKLREEANNYINDKKPIPVSLWMKIVDQRMKMFDCVKKGWVMEGFPQTREQALALQEGGYYPRHCVVLHAPENVLLQRVEGKRIDPKTDNIYHVTFNMPTDPDVQSRLKGVDGYSPSEIENKLTEYHRHIDDVLRCYEKVMKQFNADQPITDVFNQVLTFIESQQRTTTPCTPRVILLGPTGSGRALQAELLASKYNLINVSCGQLIKQAIAGETLSGQACKNYVLKDSPVPDAIVLKILKERLGQVDCITRGWVLHGYPITIEQAVQLHKDGFVPNRIFFLDVSTDSIIERLTNRYTDPVTGERYHMIYNPPRCPQVRDRLVRHPRDCDDQVRKRIAQFNAYRDEIDDFYEVSHHLNADQDPHTIFECLESMIVEPTPLKL